VPFTASVIIFYFKSQNGGPRPALADFFKFKPRAGLTTRCSSLCNIFEKCSTSRAGINREQRKSLAGSPGQPWQITGPVLAGQAKFGQYLQDAKKPRSISQTEKAVEACGRFGGQQLLQIPRRISRDDLGGTPENQMTRGCSQKLEISLSIFPLYLEILK
jgi:hypothetical protein